MFATFEYLIGLQGAGELVRTHPLCVLDFYVHERCQRSGYGQRLFDYMLADHCLHPAALAFDRPSQKLNQFLSKHYGLMTEALQYNNFLVFTGFLELSVPR
jgi:alpha-tubulin N-acetyltransferase 1